MISCQTRISHPVKIFQDQEQNKDTFKTITMFIINEPSRNDLLKCDLKENDPKGSEI